MLNDPSARTEHGQGRANVRAWKAPVVEDLPALEALTLQSPIRGGEDGFSFLDLTDPTHRLG